MARLRIHRPLPSATAAEAALRVLHDHDQLMQLGALTKDLRPTPPPAEAPPEERHPPWRWFSITERFRLPRDVGSGEFTSRVGFLNLPDGAVSHVYSQLGVEIRDHWLVRAVQVQGGGSDVTFALTVDIEVTAKFILKPFVKRKVKQSRVGFVDRIVDAALGQGPGTNQVGSPGYLPFGVGTVTEEADIDSPSTDADGDFAKELHGDSTYHHPPPQELHGDFRKELLGDVPHARAPRYELESPHSVSELDAGRRVG